MNTLDPRRMTKAQRQLVAHRLRVIARRTSSQGMTYNQGRAWMSEHYATLADLYQHCDSFYPEMNIESDGPTRMVHVSGPVKMTSHAELCLVPLGQG